MSSSSTTKSGPDSIVIEVGLSKGLGKVAKVADTVNLVAMGSTYTSSQVVCQRIPIPPGEESRAREIVKMFQGKM